MLSYGCVIYTMNIKNITILTKLLWFFFHFIGKPAYLLKRNSCPNIAMLPPRKERCVVKRKMMCNNSSQNVKRLRLQMHESASAPVKVVNERHLPHPRTRRGKRGQGKNKKHDCNPQLNQYDAHFFEHIEYFSN